MIDLGAELFVVEREWEKGKVVCISNFTDQYMELKMDGHLSEIDQADACSDLLTGHRYMGEGKLIALDAYQTVWLQV